jgi:cysteine synthase A
MHWVKLNIPAFQNIQIYLKDESTHPAGSLKHWLE